jgi:hypothetical protein
VGAGAVSPVDVQPDVYDAASTVFGQTMTAALTRAFTGLHQGLAPTAAMAGTDPGGTKWAASYDQAASATADAITTVNASCFHLAALLEKTGFNHGMAESHSDPTRRTPVPPDTTKYAPPVASYAAPPSAAGGSGSPPNGWGLIQHLVGYVWPNGDQGKLRAAAQAWSAAANTLDGASGDVSEAVRAINSQQSPEVDDAVNVCQDMGQHIRDIATSCRDLSTACSDFASAIDKAHSDIENELVSLVEWTVGIEAGGALLGAFSFGIGEGAAQVAEAARVAATAGRVGTVIGRLIEAAGTVAETIGNITTKVVEIAQRLRALLEVGSKEATVTQAAADEEVGALERLGKGCFIPGTMVLTETGHRPIEQVTVGELVVATDPLTGSRQLRRVTTTMTHTVFNLVDIEVAGCRISCSPEHPFWLQGGGWTKAADLTADDVVVDAQCREHLIEAVSTRSGVFTVHNIEVDDLHVYHVSCASILVHNKPRRLSPEEPKLRDAKWLKRNGIDPHTEKDILPGPAKWFDLYVDRNRNVWAVRKGEHPNSGEFIGNLDNFK